MDDSNVHAALEPVGTAASGFAPAVVDARARGRERAEDEARVPARRVSANPAAPAGPVAGRVAVVLLVDLAVTARWWGLLRLVRGARALAREPGLRFAQVLGSGRGGGFGLHPSTTHQGLFCVFEDDAAAEAFATTSPVVDAYRDHARELLTVRLQPLSSRGSWGGRAPFVVPDGARLPPGAPIAALTRAAIRPRHLLRFWRMAPPSEHAMECAEGCLLAAGLGEAPVIRQATFTIWESVEAMDRYARQGPHMAAIREAYSLGFFTESMFSRFIPYGARGTWKGTSLGDRVAGALAPGLIAPPT